MLYFKTKKDQHGQPFLTTSLTGKALMSIAQLNKGTAFTTEERQEFGLIGKLPPLVETLEQQVKRAYWQYSRYQDQLNKNIYLNYLLNENQVLFYKLLATHMEEMLPMIYTPIVSRAVKEFSENYMHPRGLYISFEDQDNIENILSYRTNPEVKLIVVSDGESVLGIGDQGVGAMAIPIAKLMVYTAVGGINPNNTLPILLDAGTNNQTVLDSPFYLGWRNHRVSGPQYDIFIDKFITAIKKVFPNVFLHWEDFGRHNAYQNLAKYREKISSFNDDIQGTGVVATAAILAAVKQTHIPLTEQRIVVFGAGSAGVGISETICKAMMRLGATAQQAQNCFWLIDKTGLLTENTIAVTPAQKAFLRSQQDLSTWNVNNPDCITLLETVAAVKPTLLIGTSALAGAFTQEVITTMAKYCERPVIFPLSNPTEYSEAQPRDLLEWTQGRALIATGSPFGAVDYAGQTYPISQCNNYLAYPGIGQGVVAIQAKTVTENMLWSASEVLSQYSTIQPPRLLPSITQVAQQASRAVAIAVAKTAIADGVANLDIQANAVEQLIDENIWLPHYLPYRKCDD